MIAGPTGLLELALDPVQAPQTSPRALALVAHPHPLHGGTMDNKVTTTLSRACASAGCAVVRFNYRGVGRSEGVFDHARGEVDDAQAALAWLQSQFDPKLPLILCGFSFGTAVAAQLAQRLQKSNKVQLLGMVLAGAAVQRFASDIVVDPDTTLMIHGELDDTVPLTETLAWAASLSLPISVIPRADHFFNRQLIPLRRLALRHVNGLF